MTTKVVGHSTDTTEGISDNDCLEHSRTLLNSMGCDRGTFSLSAVDCTDARELLIWLLL